MSRVAMVLIVCFLSLGVLDRKASAFEIEYGGWTTHLIDDDPKLNNRNHLVGVGYKGFEGATFVNSHYDRTYALGYLIDLPSVFSVSTGLIHGYGEKAKYFPVRYDQTVLYISGNVTFDLSQNLAIRGRLMGEVLMVSGVLSFDSGS